MSLGIAFDQNTQDLMTDSSGQLVNQNSRIGESYCRLSTPIGTCRYDTNIGSIFPGLVQNRQIITVNLIKNGVIQSLQPMVNSSRIINIDFNLLRTGISGFSIELNATDSQANTFTFAYTVQG